MDLKDPYVVRPSRDIWERWIQDHIDESRLFIRLFHPVLLGESFLASVGDPVISDHQNAVFLPIWMADANQFDACGEKTQYEILTSNQLPRAERIVLRPVELYLTEVDVVAALEKSFSRLGVLQQGKLYQVGLDELGGVEAHIYVEVLEPDDEVYLDGDEIPLEFEQSVEAFRPTERVPTPPPAPPVALTPPGEEDLMVPRNFLSGAPAPPLLPRRGFVPFSGKGHSLGTGHRRT